MHIFYIQQQSIYAEDRYRNLNFRELKALQTKTCMVVCLKENAHINSLYISVSLPKNMSTESLDTLIRKNTTFKKKLETIFAPGWFWENYF